MKTRLHEAQALYQKMISKKNSSYELRVIIPTSCVFCTSYELQVIFIAKVTSYFLHKSYEWLLIGRVVGYFLRTSYKLLFIRKVTS